ncbi:MAG: VWA domain-containing protein [Duncaniella sp.]|nr:VWA domain-containing protein [Duncaniella sp.]MDE5953498.1 VWA domain-containing protein [Duncaniella sp.]
MKLKFLSCAALLCACAFPLTSCSDDDDKTTPEDRTDIPKDNLAQPNPELGDEPNATIPNIQYTTVDEEGAAVFRIDMTGIQDKATLEWLRLLGTGEIGQNIWIEVDGQPKGVKVYNTADDNNERTLPIDLVFLVDNSASMSQEADAIARDITAWAEKLSKTSLDINFGCVGYNGAITGAVNITSYQNLSDYLNRPKVTGTNRTKEFSGSEADITLFNEQKDNYNAGYNYECGMAALRFATDLFTFRKNANRIFVNFTDEPNQNHKIDRFSVESLRGDWDTTLGTIHTVYSASQSSDKNEANRLMSEYTGGTVIYTNSSFTGVTLEDLPVTDAMRNSYVVRITNIRDLMDGQPHEVRITILSEDGTVRAERTFTVIFEAL